MNDLEMELQTIRQKLQTLKASPRETVASPWGQSRQPAPSPNLVQVTTAIETLRQRPGQTPPLAPSSHSLQQFDESLAILESLAQKQQQALRQLQTLGESLVQQSQPGTSPDIDDIARFLATCQTITIPMVQRDRNGYLELSFHTVNFRQAEHDASSNAATLRKRSPLFKYALDTSQRHTERPGWENIHVFDRLVHELQAFSQLTYRSIQRWASRHLADQQRPRNSNFTFLDGAIWCIGSMIARILLNQIFQIYPALWTPIAVLFILGIGISLCSSIVSPRPNPVLGYRTLMTLVGLLIGGRFS
ncbi:hypothetical protein IQ260_00945 [Leptolyngbya cf. ectocarpi LEGE 11479]|uniref:Uncharacterized protein n=1 Tax=Leptolyngbya cf. ectocarpi LEGE 11479 TaxID=1828722 RepID=A0A928ZQC0_LEPEC|nr:hypothetical protein [Leptolyngbya ectocarpi]MBE9065218.1 hypothetical protein [Leptolyngbya cf. ectocarpi LEGE 11479]